MREYNYKRFFSFLMLISLIFLSSNLVNAGQGSSFNRIIYFGDSLSDNGNLFFYDYGFLPKSPPYFNGRFTNGYVWSDHVAKYFYDKNFTGSTNYAIGGETAILHDPTQGYLPYSLTLSLNSYLIRSMLSDRAKTLYIIWIGSNDYLKGANDVDLLATAVVDNIKATIENLIYHGGMNFLIINLPDIAKTPYGIESEFNETLHALTLAHNSKLAAAVSQIEENFKSVNIHLYDVSSLFEKLISNPDHYNKKYKTQVVNVSKACWNGGYYFDKKKYSEKAILLSLQDRIRKQSKSMKITDSSRKLNPEEFAHYVASSPALSEAYMVTEENLEGGQLCNNPNGHVFWDRLHPSAVMHMMLSRGIIDFINQNYYQT